MKKLLIVNLLCLIAFMANAQDKPKKSIPKSPESAFTQQFGGSEIQVAYARPSARGRKIFGALVPFDSLWRTGANDCTQITFKDEVVMGDKKIAAGKYSFFTIPTATDWTIILNSETTGHGTSAYKTENDVHRFKVKSEKSDRFYETFTIEINDFDAKGDASLNLMWENTMVKIPLKNSMDAMVATTDMKPKMDAHAGHDMSKMDNGLKAQFAPVLAAYYSIKDALTADNSNLSAENGKAMKTALRKIDTKNWTAKERNAYDEVAKKLDTDAEHIGDNAGKINQQRDRFVTLSNNLSTLTKALKINSEPAYLQYCPMANGGKGAYWLSKENKVKNPYYGKSMLTCGSVKETL
jgi:hypothetical protein